MTSRIGLMFVVDEVYFVYRDGMVYHKGKPFVRWMIENETVLIYTWNQDNPDIWIGGTEAYQRWLAQEIVT